MNPKQVTILAILVALAGGVYFMVNQKRESSINREETKKIGDRAVEDFKVADVNQVMIQQKGRKVVLNREGENWLVAERGDYTADATKIRGVLFAVKDMKIAESRSMRGEAALKALQLLSPDQSDQGGAGAGTLVSLAGANASRMLVFGSNYDSPGRSGRFIKTEDGSVYVVSTVLRNLETDPAAWLDKEFFKVENSEKITISHEKPEDSYTLVRESEGSPLSLEGAAEGEEVNSSKLGSLNNLLSSANFADYIVGEAAAPEKTGLDKPTTVTIETFDGFTYVLGVGKKTDDSKYYLSYQVSAEIPAAPEPGPEPNEEEDNKLTEEERTKKRTEREIREEKRAEHKRLTEKLAKEQKFAGKVYTVDSWLVEKVDMKRGDLLMSEEEKKEAAKAAANPGGGASPGIGAPPGIGASPGIGAGALSPNIISQGPNGGRRITATTPPVSVDPKILEAERKKQEKAVIENQKSDNDAAAIRQMLEDHKREKAEGEKKANDPEGGTEEAEESEPSEAAAGSTEEEPAEEEPAEENATEEQPAGEKPE